MKIAIVHPSDGCSPTAPSAPAILIHQYTKHSLEQGAHKKDICVLSGWVENPFDDIQTWTPPKETPPYAKNNISLFAKKIEDLGADIVEVHLHFRWAVALAKALPLIPIVYYRHNPSERAIWIRLLGRSLRYCYLAGIISVSRFCHQRLIHLHPEHKKRHHVITNALKASEWQSDSNKKEKIIVFSGRPITEKGIAELADALLRTLPDFPDWKFVALFAIPFRKESDSFNAIDTFGKQQIKKLKPLGSQFQWRINSSREEIQDWLKKSCIAVVPSNYDENFPLTVLEAHLSQCAVISSGRGGMREVSGEDGALYLDEVSAEAITEKLRHLMENQETREQLAKKGYDYVIKHHNINNRVEELDALRKQIISQAKQERTTLAKRKKQVRKQQLRAFAAKL